MSFMRPNSNSPISAKTRNNIMIFVFVIVMAVVVFDNLRLRNKQKSQSNQTVNSSENSANPDFQKYNNKTFHVVYIVDGDTIDINIPNGKYRNTRIRLLGIDTPETKNPRMKEVMYFGPESSRFVKELAFNKDITVHLDTISPTRDRYGRLLAYIELPNGNCLNEQIVKEGYGYADSRFANSRMDIFKEAQKAAIQNNKGLWKNVTSAQLPSWFAKEYPQITASLVKHK